MARWIDVGRLADIPRGTAVAVSDGPVSVAVFNVAGELFAIDNRCPHANAPLAEGDLEGHTVHCPLHGWTFDVKTGHCGFMPSAKVRCYPLRVAGERVQVDVELAAPR